MIRTIERLQFSDACFGNLKLLSVYGFDLLEISACRKTFFLHPGCHCFRSKILKKKKKHVLLNFFYDRYWVSNEDVQLFTDSAGGADLGFGAYFAGKWTCAHWPQWWIDQGITADITVLEMFPLLVCLHIWGQELKNKKIVFRSDNLSSVHIINSMTSKNDEVMIILRAITLLCLQLNIAFKALHVRGCFNRLADTLSRFQLQKFHELAPDADPEPSTVPNHLWNIFKQV